MAIQVVPDYDISIQFIDLWRDHISTLPQMLYHNVKHLGERPASIYRSADTWKTITYKEWAAVSEEIGNALLSVGLEKSDAVSIISPTIVEWGWADFGTAFAGGCTVSIFPTLSDFDIKFIMNHSAVKYCFAGTPELVNKILNLKHELPTLQGIICLAGDYNGDGIETWSLEQFQNQGREYQKQNPTALLDRCQSISGDDPAATVYTSGTTGKLKAARFSHEEVIGGIWRSNRALAMGKMAYISEEVYLSVMPLAHVMERTYGYWCIISMGACTAYGRGPLYVMQDMQEIRPTATVLVPRMMDRILKGMKAAFTATPEGEQAWKWAMSVGERMIDARMTADGVIDLSKDPLEDLTGPLKEDYIKAKELVFNKVHGALGGRMRCFSCGGAALLPNLHRAWVGMGLFVSNGYGLTETICGVGISRCNATKISWSSPICPGLEWKQDEDGELLVKGVGIIKEYYNDPEATAECFTEDGYFRTGDILEFDDNGIFTLVDRKKAILVMDTGKNVAPAKCEALVMREVMIDQVMILGDGKKYVAALICPNWDDIMKVLDQKGVSYDKSALKYEIVNGMNACVEVGPDLANNPLTIAMVEQAVNDANAELAEFETIKKHKILTRKFLQRLDELTPTLKTKSRIIIEHFAADVNALFD